MKKLLQVVWILLMGMSLQAQTTVNVSGTVTDVNGVAQSNVAIEIAVPPNPIFNYSNTVLTNSSGQYSDSFNASVPQGILNVSMFDCDSTSVGQVLTWFGDSISLVANFVFCDVNAPDCDVTLSYDTLASGAILTANPSGQAPFSYLWSDGSTNPVLIANSSGYYCVTTTDAVGCAAVACDSILLGGGCSVFIQSSPAGGLFAGAIGQAPFTYTWNTGETGSFINPTTSGEYCVTITAADGCTATNCMYYTVNNIDTLCSAYIYLDTLNAFSELTAQAIQTMALPVGYLWSTGDTSMTIQVTEPGQYCVIVSFDNGCIADACYDYQPFTGCSVNTFYVQNGACILASAIGTGPFVYNWSDGSTTASICPNTSGLYCVTTTDAAGCVASDCLSFATDSCSVFIYDTLSPVNPILFAEASGVAPFTYQWSDGSVLPTLFPNGPGTYCVTVTDALGCVATACYNYQPGNGCSVSAFYVQNGACIQASAMGAAPFAYNWSDGSTTASICPNTPGLYCVTTTDANGCIASDCLTFATDSCSVIIYDTLSPIGTYLFAEPSGVAPFTYQWSDGSILPTILPNASGTYCVTVTDALGCVATSCYFYQGGMNCSVMIYDSLASMSGALHADPFGTGPFTFEWSTGETTQGIVPNGVGTYCVTVTDATGCVASDCHFYQGGCSVSVFNVQNGACILASPIGVAPYTYVWNDTLASTTSSICPTESGTYCVTVTDASGCVSTACTFFSFQPYNTISGTVYPEDTLNLLQLSGTAFLIQYDTVGGGTLSLIDTVPLMSTPNGWTTYDFGAVPDGEYLVKVALDENSPGYATNLPTYHYSSLFWNTANPITIPYASPNWFNVILVEGNNPGGPGFIGGLVVEGANFDGFVETRNGEGDPIADILIILLDDNENAVAYTYTNEEGEYEFPNLAWGTYEVVVEIPGFEQARHFVTISPDVSTVDDIIFAVDEDSVALLDATNLNEIRANTQLKVAPNPVQDQLIIQLEMPQAGQLDLELIGLDGQLKLQQSNDLGTGWQTLSLNLSTYPAGMYFLRASHNGQQWTQKVVKK